jgi:hypothetical protein
MEFHLKIVGWVFVILAWVHVIFPRYFDWKNDLRSLSLINREVMYVHTFFVALMVLGMGLLCLTSASDLIETTLGRRISLGFGLFWVIRLFIQFFGYSSELWRGKHFETVVHIVFSMLWTYVSWVFLEIYFH